MVFAFLIPGPLIDGEISLALAETGFKGPKDDPFPYYRFNIVHTDTGQTVGRITLRVGDADGILKYPGHIGYDVDPAHRGNHYAARSVFLLFGLAKAHGLADFWIGCSEDNHASRKTCERLGGILVETIPVPQGIDLYDQGMRTMCRYRVHVDGRTRSDRRKSSMKDWTKNFAEDLWLKPDEVGADEAAFIRRALRLCRGSKVLDAPCGAGRIAIHLAHAGCAVTGIDLRASFIQRAEARFCNESQEGRFQTMDLREISFQSEFDGIYSWLGSFGYFADAVNADVMRRYAAALRPGGRLLIDQINREFILRHFIECHTSGDRTNRNKWNPTTKRVESDWIVKRGGASEHNRLSMRLYTPREMGDLFAAAGLTVERMYGSKAGEPYKRGSKRLIVVGRKLNLAMENSTRPECCVQKGSTER